MDREIRALKATVIVLLALAAGRWLLAPPERNVSVTVPGTTELLDSSRAELEESEARSLPLADGEKIDPNSADEIALDRLPGVGPATARRIVEEREANGPFESVADLERVRGIGPATLAKMAPSLQVDATALGSFGRPARLERAASGERGGGGRSGSREVGAVDINLAGSEELQSLPGIGPALAGRILEARREAPFGTIDDLLRVRGIGTSTLERLRPLVTVGREGSR